MRASGKLLILMLLLVGWTLAFAAAQTYEKSWSGGISQAGELSRIEELRPRFFDPIYYADASKIPGSVYYANRSTSASIIYSRPSGRLYSFVFHPGVPEKLYYVDANQNSIYRSDERWSGWSEEYSVYTHSTYVRDIAFASDSTGHLDLYFSEATGAKANGKIYKLEDGSPVVIYTVRLSEVGGSWAGNFAFDNKGNLYLSSGNSMPASIYRVNNGSVTPVEIFRDKGPITGMVYKSGYIYYADWRNNIYRLDLRTMEKTLYYTINTTSTSWISDVGFRERVSDPAELPKAGSYPLSVIGGIPTSPEFPVARRGV